MTEIDISGFFEAIDHEKMMASLGDRIDSRPATRPRAEEKPHFDFPAFGSMLLFMSKSLQHLVSVVVVVLVHVFAGTG